MDTKIHIELGFKIDGIYFGWHDQVLYQLPHINNGRYFGLRAIKPKTTKGGWVYYRIRRKKVGKGEGDLEAWVQSKITKAADYIDTAADYVASGEMEEQRLVDRIMDEMKCWSGYEKKGTQKLFGKKYNRCVKKEDVTIEDANGNTFAEVVPAPN